MRKILFSNFLKRFDIFGTPIALFYNNSTVYKTPSGGFLTGILLTLMIIFCLSLLTRAINQSEINFFVSNTYYDVPPPLDLNLDQLDLAITVDDPTMSLDVSKIGFRMAIGTDIRFSNGTKISQLEFVPLKPCTVNNFEEYEEEFDQNGLGNGLCLAESLSVTLYGTGETSHFRYIKIFYEQCNNATHNSNFIICDTEQNIQDYWAKKNRVRAIIYYKQSIFNPSNLQNPIQVYLDRAVGVISYTGLAQQILVKVQNQQLESHQNFWNKDIIEYFNLINFEDHPEIWTWIPPSTNTESLIFEIKGGQIATNIIRSIVGLSDVLGQFGGIWSLLFGICSVVAKLNNTIEYQKEIADLLFEYDNSTTRFQYLTENLHNVTFKTITKKNDEKLYNSVFQYCFSRLIAFLKCKTNNTNLKKKIELQSEALSLIQQRIDIRNMAQKNEELIRLKKVIFNEKQSLIFENLPSTKIVYKQNLCDNTKPQDQQKDIDLFSELLEIYNDSLNLPKEDLTRKLINQMSLKSRVVLSIVNAENKYKYPEKFEQRIISNVLEAIRRFKELLIKAKVRKLIKERIVKSENDGFTGGHNLISLSDLGNFFNDSLFSQQMSQENFSHLFILGFYKSKILKINFLSDHIKMNIFNYLLESFQRAHTLGKLALLSLLGISTLALTSNPVSDFFRKQMSKNQDLQRKYGMGTYVLIMSAAKNIGKTFAKEFAKKGFNLILIDDDENELTRLKEALSSKYPSNDIKSIIVYDINDISDNTYSAVQKIIQKLDVSIFVNDVGVSKFHRVPSNSSLKESCIALGRAFPLLLTKQLLSQFSKRRERSAIILVGNNQDLNKSGTFDDTSTQNEFELLVNSLAYDFSQKVDFVTVSRISMGSSSFFRKEAIREAVSTDGCVKYAMRQLMQGQNLNILEKNLWSNYALQTIIQNGLRLNKGAIKTSKKPRRAFNDEFRARRNKQLKQDKHILSKIYIPTEVYYPTSIVNSVNQKNLLS